MIRDQLVFQPIWNLSTAVHFAQQMETRLSRASHRSSNSNRAPFSRTGDRSKSHSPASPHSTPSLTKPPIESAASASKTASKVVVQVGKSNLYTKSMMSKNYCCNEVGHKSNECPRLLVFKMIFNAKACI